jgi:hypothetical protein
MNEVFVVSVGPKYTPGVPEVACTTLDLAKHHAQHHYAVTPIARSDGTWAAYRTATDIVTIHRLVLQAEQ